MSGGTYEYGYRYLGPTLGFTAGWMFLSAKSASAATAALGLAGEVGELRPGAWADLVAWRVPLAGDPLEALTTGAAGALKVWIADRRVR